MPQSTATTSESSLQSWDFTHSWHPFAQMQEYTSAPPVHIASGEGVWLTDTEGNSYLDATASIWTNVHGHNDPDLNRALREQLENVAHSTMLGLSHPIGTKLARKLAEISPGDLNRSFFSDNGSNAVEIALKMSFQFWQLTGKPKKRRVISMENSYHGDTFGTMAVGDSQTFHSRFSPWFFPTDKFPAPTCHELAGEILSTNESESLQNLENLLEHQADKTACLILEPSVQGSAGMLQQPPGFLQKVAALCRRHDVHLILDEIFVAFGRLGSLLVCAEEKVVPDFLCLAKGLTAGYLPLAATVVREPIYEAFLGPYESYRAFFHGHTFTGNPLAAAVSLANIEKLEPMVASGEIREKIAFFGKTIRKTFAEHPQIREIRQRGLTAALELVPDSRSSKNFPISLRFGHQVALTARKHGLLLRPIMDTIL
ncbi:MAG TPA: adenosylmethionine--8-amino-7-oxononanoate transaminase, partial [Opitutales bacterium]|nr:adenosylmethionine--8-amino-7-oxononanoate transaminase [Opitutales bacterium]